MSLRNFIHSFKNIKKNNTFKFRLISPRDTLDIIFFLETLDNSAYSYDIGDGLIKTTSPNPFSVSEFLDLNTIGFTTFYKKKSEIKSLSIGSNSYNIDSSELFGFNNLRLLYLDTNINLIITNIPHSVNNLTIEGNGSVQSYVTRRSFTYTTMQRFVLRNQGGAGLSTNDVDNLLIDLSQANWTGAKRVEILGINSSRSSSSDAAIATLQGKGVLVLTN